MFEFGMEGSGELIEEGIAKLPQNGWLYDLDRLDGRGGRHMVQRICVCDFLRICGGGCVEIGKQFQH